jgi:hypothetical protein
MSRLRVTNAEMMRGEFIAVEPLKKIAIHVLPRRRMTSLIFQYTPRVEFNVSSRWRLMIAPARRTARVLFAEWHSLPSSAQRNIATSELFRSTICVCLARIENNVIPSS